MVGLEPAVGFEPATSWDFSQTALNQEDMLKHDMSRFTISRRFSGAQILGSVENLASTVGSDWSCRFFRFLMMQHISQSAEKLTDVLCTSWGLAHVDRNAKVSVDRPVDYFPFAGREFKS